MQWVPNPEWLGSVLDLLRLYSTATNEQHLAIVEAVNKHSENHEFSLYLAYIFCEGGDRVDATTRQLAGVLCKNNILAHYDKFSPAHRTFLKNQILSCLGDPNRNVRRTVASMVTAIVQVGKFADWPELLHKLSEALTTEATAAVVEGTFSVLTVLVEDHTTELEAESIGDPLADLVPKLILFLQHPSVHVRNDSLTCLLHLEFTMPPALAANVPQLLLALGNLTTDPSAEVRCNVCKCLVALVEERASLIDGAARTKVIEFMLYACEHEEESVKLVAMEFWTSFADQDDDGRMRPILDPFFPRIAAVILNSMQFSEEQLVDLPVTDVVDAHIPDRAQDIRARLVAADMATDIDGDYHHRSDDPTSYDEDGVDDGDADEAKGDSDGEADADAGSDDDKDIGDSSYDRSAWTLRKCAAYALEALCLKYQGHFILHVFPMLSVAYANTSQEKAAWLAREAAVMALGCMIRSCSTVMDDHLESAFSFLIPLVDDPMPLVRCITFWCLSNFSEFISSQSDRAAYLERYLGVICVHMLDHTKRVQQSACSSLSSVNETAGPVMTVYMDRLLPVIDSAFKSYQVKSRMSLLDVVGTLADACGTAVNTPQFRAQALAHVLHLWSTVDDTDPMLMPLMECMTSVEQAFGEHFMEYAPQVLEKCATLIDDALVAVHAGAEVGESAAGVRGGWVLALDCLAGLVSAIRVPLVPLLQHYNVVEKLFLSCQDSSPGVRQSAFALLGELASSTQAFVPVYDRFVPCVAAGLADEADAIRNNAAWAAGEMAASGRGVLKPALRELLPLLVQQANEDTLHVSARSNALVALCRCAFVDEQIMAGILPQFAKAWVRCMVYIRDLRERTDCFNCLFAMLVHNAPAMREQFIGLCHCISLWQNPPPDMQERIQTILNAFKQSFGGGWPQVVHLMPKDLYKFLRTHYGV